jgi:hypothetical protein
VRRFEEDFMSDANEVWWNLHQLGASTVCPICSNTDWVGFGELGNVKVLLPGLLGSGEMMRTPNQAGGMSAYAFACARCGFLRLHASQVVANETPELDGHPR